LWRIERGLDGMKKLALASVAFAGVTAFGAGDSFAAGFTGFTSGPAGFASTDTAVWSIPYTDAGGTGGSAGATIHSVLHNIRTTVSFASTTAHQNPTLTAFNQNCSGSTGHAICAGFKPNTHVLGDNAFEGTGLLELGFNKNLSAFGLSLSNVGRDWGATLTLFDGAADIGDVKLSDLATCRGTSNITGCHTPVFLGAIVTGQVITGASLALTGSGPLIIGTLFQALPTSKIPEPISLSVLGVGLLGLGVARRRRHAHDPADGSRWSPFGRWRVANSPPDPKHLLS
jgi:hypothetical protein